MRWEDAAQHPRPVKDYLSSIRTCTLQAVVDAARIYSAASDDDDRRRHSRAARCRQGVAVAG